jgi:hypothetical protein
MPDKDATKTPTSPGGNQPGHTPSSGQGGASPTPSKGTGGGKTQADTGDKATGPTPPKR